MTAEEARVLSSSIGQPFWCAVEDIKRAAYRGKRYINIYDISDECIRLLIENGYELCRISEEKTMCTW